MICIDNLDAGRNRFIILHLIDNGTIDMDGVMIPEVKEATRSLAGRAAIHFITADTFRFVTQQVSGIGCEVKIIP